MTFHLAITLNYDLFHFSQFVGKIYAEYIRAWFTALRIVKCFEQRESKSLTAYFDLTLGVNNNNNNND